jgi:hypothetical protein
MTSMLLIPLISLILLGGIWLFIVITCIYTGVIGLRGRPISLPSRGGGVWNIPAKGTAARVIGAIFLAIGFIFLILPLRAVLRMLN